MWLKVDVGGVTIHLSGRVGSTFPSLVTFKRGGTRAKPVRLTHDVRCPRKPRDGRPRPAAPRLHRGSLCTAPGPRGTPGGRPGPLQSRRATAPGSPERAVLWAERAQGPAGGPGHRGLSPGPTAPKNTPVYPHQPRLNGFVGSPALHAREKQLGAVNWARRAPVSRARSNQLPARCWGCEDGPAAPPRGTLTFTHCLTPENRLGRSLIMGKHLPLSL